MAALYHLSMSITLTDAAATRLEALRAKQGKESLYLRIVVDGGGCQGFEYKLSFTDQPEGDDVFVEADAYPVGAVTDPMSHGFLSGSVVDYEDELVGARFVVKNPNATSSCGCGTSFNIA